MMPGSRTWSAMVAEVYRTDRTAVIARDGRWTGRELLDRASAVAHWVDSAGLPAGSPVPALFGQTTADAVAATIGCAALGHPLAPLSPRMTVPELTPAVARLGGPLLVAEPEAEALAGEVAVATGTRAAVLDDAALTGLATASADDLPVPAPDAVASYMHTSGTTGAPKPVPVRQDRLHARSRVNTGLLLLDTDAVYATASPWHHIAGIGNVSVALAAGAAIVVVPRFTVASWLELQELGPTHGLLVPSMLEMLLAADALRPGSLRVLQYGASPIHPATLAQVLRTLPDVSVVNLFGQTEGSPITCLGPDDHRRAASTHPNLLRSVGRAAPGVEIHIVDPDDHGVGEVHARAEHLLLPDADGWLRTGDLGRLDDEGYLYLSGRRGDKIVRGGENVYPVEVENVLDRHPEVAEVAVVGLPERRLGETVAAFVVPRDRTSPPDEAELRTFARTQLAGFKVPTEWHFVDGLPRTQTGKVQRRRLVPP